MNTPLLSADLSVDYRNKPAALDGVASTFFPGKSSV